MQMDCSAVQYRYMIQDSNFCYIKFGLYQKWFAISILFFSNTIFSRRRLHCGLSGYERRSPEEDCRRISLLRDRIRRHPHCSRYYHLVNLDEGKYSRKKSFDLIPTFVPKAPGIIIQQSERFKSFARNFAKIIFFFFGKNLDSST